MTPKVIPINVYRVGSATLVKDRFPLKRPFFLTAIGVYNVATINAALTCRIVDLLTGKDILPSINIFQFFTKNQRRILTLSEVGLLEGFEISAQGFTVEKTHSNTAPYNIVLFGAE